MSETVQTKYVDPYKSIQLPVNDLEQVMTYSGDKLLTIRVDYLDVRYTQTFTYTSENLTDVSQFVPSAIPAPMGEG